MKNLFVFLSLVLLVGCNTPDYTIKKDLNSRFTKIEIVEIRLDSANVCDIGMRKMNLKINIIDGISKMATAEKNYWDKRWTRNQALSYMDTITNDLNKRGVDFLKLENSKAEQCYYVKYKIFKDELKIEKEEYYYIRPYGDGKTEVIHRTCVWDDYLEDLAQSIKESNDYYISFLRNSRL